MKSLRKCQIILQKQQVCVYTSNYAKKRKENVLQMNNHEMLILQHFIDAIKSEFINTVLNDLKNVNVNIDVKPMASINMLNVH